MIININGHPGVGKLTIGRELCRMIDGRLLDNHSVYNIAFALTEFRSPEFYETVSAVRRIAYDRVLALPVQVPVVLTSAHAQDSAWGNACWDEVVRLARARGSELFVVVLHCSPEENARRIQGPEREGKRKPRDPEMYTRNLQGRPLLDRDGDYTLGLDVTELAADEAARVIAEWVRDLERG